MVEGRLASLDRTATRMAQIVFLLMVQKQRLNSTRIFNLAKTHIRFSLVPAAGDRFVFASEQLAMPGTYRKPYSLGRGHVDSQVISLTGRRSQAGRRPRQAELLLPVDIKLAVYHFHDTGPTARVKKKHELRDNQTLHVDAANLAAYLYRIKHEYHKHTIPRGYCKTVQLALPFFRRLCIGA